MKAIQFPVKFLFKISTLSNDFTATDANGKTIAYVRQKMFKLKEAIEVFDNEQKSNVNYRINANKWLDFSTAYAITRANGESLGKIARKGWRSIWKAQYDLIDQNDQLQYKVSEKNAWVKVADHFLGEIPVLSLFTGYLFNPSYTVTANNGEVVALLKKDASFFGRKFTISKLKEIDEDDQERIILGLMMMILLERRRG